MTKEQIVASTIKHQLNVATRDDTNLKLKSCVYLMKNKLRKTFNVCILHRKKGN